MDDPQTIDADLAKLQELDTYINTAGSAYDQLTEDERAAKRAERAELAAKLSIA